MSSLGFSGVTLLDGLTAPFDFKSLISYAYANLWTILTTATVAASTSSTVRRPVLAFCLSSTNCTKLRSQVILYLRWDKGLKSSFCVSQIVQHYFIISPKLCPGNVHLKHPGCEYSCLQFQSWNTNKLHRRIPSLTKDESAMNSSIGVLASQI